MGNKKENHNSVKTEFKKGNIPWNRLILSDGSFYPSITSLCECRNLNCSEIVYDRSKYVVGHSGRSKNVYHKLTLSDGSWYPFIPTICPCGCNDIILYSKKNASFRCGHYARINHPRNRLGCKSTESTKEKLKESFSGSNNPMFGISPSPKCHRGHGSYYESPLQGQVYLRSSWELKYAQYLDQNKILWMYEIETFPIIINNKNYTYTPDFFLPKFEKFIEIKGNPKGNADKIQQFREEYTFDLDVLIKEDLQNLGIKV